MNYEILNTSQFSNRELDVYGNFLEEMTIFADTHENAEDDLASILSIAPDDEFVFILEKYNTLFWYPYEEVLDVIKKVREIEEFDL